MFFYTPHRHTVSGQNVHTDVPLCHSGDLVPYHKYTDGPQQVCVDVHSEDSIRKKYTFFKKVTTNLVTPHRKRYESIGPFQLLLRTHKIISE